MNLDIDKKEYPFISYYFSINGVNLHYLDEGKDKILLFVHGTPTCSFDFRNLIKHFCNNYRCITIDHIGFGLSDKPADYDYSTVNHSKTLDFFITQQQFKNINLILHDFVGHIALTYAIHNASNIHSIAVINSWRLWSSKHTEKYNIMEKNIHGPLISFLYLYLNFSAKVLLPNSFGANKIKPDILKIYTTVLSKKSERYGALAFTNSLITDQNWFEELCQSKLALSDKPFLLIWGLKDSFIDNTFFENFKTGFRNVTSVTFEEAGHFPHEEHSQEVINAIDGFLQFQKLNKFP